MKSPKQYDIALLNDGNKAEFEKVYNDFFEVLYALSFQYAADRFVAENMVQDAFMKLWEVRGKLLPSTNIKNFLYTITKNLCLNYLRDQKTAWKNLDEIKRLEYDYSIRSLNSIGENYAEFEELKNKIEQSVDNLPEPLKAVFIMSRHDELKYSEIAGRLQISEKTVEARMTKALRIIRVELKDYLFMIIIML